LSTAQETQRVILCPTHDPLVGSRSLLIPVLALSLVHRCSEQVKRKKKKNARPTTMNVSPQLFALHRTHIYSFCFALPCVSLKEVGWGCRSTALEVRAAVVSPSQVVEGQRGSTPRCSAVVADTAGGHRSAVEAAGRY
jgi:predicted secreted protein